MYQPLQPGSIRLLEIAPDKEEESLRGKLVEHKVSQQAEYVALSYYWGSPTFNRTIHLPDPLPLTETLNHALCHARGKTHTVQIWADAVCIDQASIAERNSQVLMMGEIYANAVLVLVDLGSSEGDSPTVESCATTSNRHEIPLDQVWEFILRDTLKLGVASIGRPCLGCLVRITSSALVYASMDHTGSCLHDGSVDVLRGMDSVLLRFCEPLWCYISSAEITNRFRSTSSASFRCR